MKKVKFKEKKTWLIVFSFVYLIIAVYYLITLIYWDNYYNNLNILTDKIGIYFHNERYFLIKMLIFMLLCSFIFWITWIVLKIKKVKQLQEKVITPQ